MTCNRLLGKAYMAGNKTMGWRSRDCPYLHLTYQWLRCWISMTNAIWHVENQGAWNLCVKPMENLEQFLGGFVCYMQFRWGFIRKDKPPKDVRKVASFCCFLWAWTRFWSFQIKDTGLLCIFSFFMLETWACRNCQ